MSKESFEMKFQVRFPAQAKFIKRLKKGFLIINKSNSSKIKRIGRLYWYKKHLFNSLTKNNFRLVLRSTKIRLKNLRIYSRLILISYNQSWLFRKTSNQMKALGNIFNLELICLAIRFWQRYCFMKVTGFFKLQSMIH